MSLAEQNIVAKLPPRKPTQPDAPSLASLARQALADADGKVDVASAALSRTLLADKALLRSVIEAAVRDAVAGHVRGAMRHDRQAIVRASRIGLDASDRMASFVARSLLDLPLAGGLKLRDANKKQVLEQAEIYMRQGADMLAKGKWLRAVAKALPAGKTVGDGLSEAKVAQLFEEARK